MNVKSPFYFLGWVLWALCWPFWQLFGSLVRVGMKSDAVWNWFIAKLTALDPTSPAIQHMQNHRRMFMSGGADVSLPPTVARETSDEAKTSGEAK